jgi:hypothetical protein
MQRLSISLNLDELTLKRLSALQARFALACQATYKVAAGHNCFSRVALHHLAYRPVREAFADLGAQLVSNTIYVVSAAARGGVDKLKPESFGATLPVVLDRKTVSLSKNQLSLFTLEGRLRLNLKISVEVQELFESSELKEIHLQPNTKGFALVFFVKSVQPEMTF